MGTAGAAEAVTIANQGTAFKFHRMANVQETYEPGALVRGGPYVGVTRCLLVSSTRACSLTVRAS
jgi:ureidoglycolate hydrolase